MKRYVIDASVAAKWLIPEADTDKAESLIDRNIERVVPDLLFPEIGNVLWKHVRTSKLTIEEAGIALQTLTSIPLTVFPVADFMNIALDIATGYGSTFYDSTYLALAVRERATLLTADAKLVRKLANTPLAEAILDISALAA